MNQKIFDIIVNSLSNFLFSKQEEVQIPIDLPSGARAENKEEVKKPEIQVFTPDWENKDDKITQHFTVGDALTLHSWNRLATQIDGADFDKITLLCKKMEQIRKILGCPINVHCMYRSPDYNKSQHIKPEVDAHALSVACDFDANPHMTIQQIKDKLEPLLEELDIRMEKGTSTWTHIDMHRVGPSGRYFTA